MASELAGQCDQIRLGGRQKELSPRPYRLGQRASAIAATRSRILSAARQVLTAKAGLSGFTLDVVARKAGVARMTVYYQFRSKLGLLEALYDTLSTNGELGCLPDAFLKPDPLAALLTFIDVFIRFWSSDRLLIRRLHALASLDPEIAQGLSAREAQRRQGLEVILTRIREQYGHPTPEKSCDAADALYTLTSFETFDRMAGCSHRASDVSDSVKRLGLAVVVLYGAEID